MSTLPPVADRGRSSQVLSITVPAAVGAVPGVQSVKATGRFLYIVDSPDRIRMRLNAEPYVDARSGTGLECEEGSHFEWFELENPNAIAVTVTVYVGFARYIDQRVSVIDGPTIMVAGPGGQIASLDAVTIPPAITGTRLRRKEITVTNGSGEMRLFVQDEAGNNALIVFPGHNVILPVSGPIRVQNPNGAACEYYTSEIYWVSAL